MYTEFHNLFYCSVIWCYENLLKHFSMFLRAVPLADFDILLFTHFSKYLVNIEEYKLQQEYLGLLPFIEKLTVESAFVSSL